LAPASLLAISLKVTQHRKLTIISLTSNQQYKKEKKKRTTKQNKIKPAHFNRALSDFIFYIF